MMHTETMCSSYAFMEKHLSSCIFDVFSQPEPQTPQRAAQHELRFFQIEQSLFNHDERKQHCELLQTEIKRKE